MSITNTWTVTKLECHPEYEGEANVVYNVHWHLSATDGTHVGTAYGSHDIPVDGSAAFVPFEELTEEQVIGWVHAVMGPEQVEFLEEAVAAQIAEAYNTPLSPPLPWAAA